MKRSLSKKEILGGNNLNRVFSARKYKIENMGLYCNDNIEGFSRFAVCVAKKYGCAVERNYAKRIVREIYRQYKDSLTGCCDMVFVVYTRLLTYLSAQKLMLGLLTQAGLISKD